MQPSYLQHKRSNTHGERQHRVIQDTLDRTASSNQHTGFISSRRSAVCRAVPAVIVKAGGTDIWQRGVRPVGRALENSARHARREVIINGTVTASDHVPAVGDDGITLLVAVGQLEGREVGVVGVGAVRQINDQGGGAGDVLGVAAEESRAGVETQVDEGVLVRHGGEGGAVGDAGLETALVGCDQGGTVGPVVVCVSGGVDGEDDVDGTLGLDQRVQRDVLAVFTTVDDVEVLGCGVILAAVAVAGEGVGGVDGDVVVPLTEVLEDVSEGILQDRGDAGAVDLEEELVEQGGGRSHNKAGIVEAAHAGAVVRDGAVLEPGAQILQGSEGVDAGVERAEFPRVHFINGGIGLNDDFAGVAAVGDDNRHGVLAVLEVVHERNGGPCVVGTTLVIGGVHQLVGQRTAPVVGKGSVKTSVSLAVDFLGDVLPVFHRADDLDVVEVGSLEQGLVEAPDLLAGLQFTDGGEVVDEHGSDQPATTTQTRDVGCRLQQTTQLTGVGGIVGAAVESLQRTSSVGERTVSTTRSRNCNVGDVGDVAGVFIDVGGGIKAGEVETAKEVLHRGEGRIATDLEPLGLVGGDARGITNARTSRGTGDIGGSVAIGGIGEGADD